MSLNIAAIYCDDIRDEVGNKLSLIGVYHADLVVQTVPAALPKLCIFAQLYSEIGQRFPADSVVKVLLDEEVVAEYTVPDFPDNLTSGEDVFQVFKLRMVFSPFVVTKECKLRVRAYVEGNEVKAPALRIQVAPSPEGVASAETP